MAHDETIEIGNEIGLDPDESLAAVRKARNEILRPATHEENLPQASAADEALRKPEHHYRGAVPGQSLQEAEGNLIFDTKQGLDVEGSGDDEEQVYPNLLQSGVDQPRQDAVEGEDREFDESREFEAASNGESPYLEEEDESDFTELKKNSPLGARPLGT